MGYTDKKITAPVSVSDVQSAIGSSSPELGVLCQDSNINMWAKYKPVVNAIIDTTSQLNSARTGWKTEAQLGTTKAWWRGSNGQCGLSFPMVDIGSSSVNNSGVITALNSLKTIIDGNLNGWSYIKPSGGTNSPFRQLDFLRYWSAAPNPVKGISIIPTQVQGSLSSSWSIGCTLLEPDVDNIDNRDNIVPQDIVTAVLGANRKLTFGFAIFKSDKTPMAWTTGNSWEGIGIQPSDYSGSEVSTAQSGGEIVTTARFKSNGRYFLLPVYFILINITDLNQPLANMSKNPSNAICKLVPIPFTKFYEFSCLQVSTSQRYGNPKTSNHDITALGKYVANIYLERNSTYYNATGYNIPIAWGLFSDAWNKDYNNPATWVSGTYMGYVTTRIDIQDTTSSTITLQNNYTVTGVPTLDHTWTLVIWVAGEHTSIALRSKGSTNQNI